MDIKELKNIVCETIDKYSNHIIEIGQKIYNNPELGYKEFFASSIVIDEFKKLGLEVQKEIAITGSIGIANGDKDGPTISVMGELDAVICREHPDANNDTGAIHACGHNIQVAGMLGAAIGLISSGAIDHLQGKIKFIAVPAEEYVELEYRSQLKKEGKIKYYGGKQELIHSGHLDDTDIAIMFHALASSDDTTKALVGPTGNGFVGKEVQFIGKESHAGSAPEEGVNALNAAILAINNIHAQRETFSDEDKIRVHPIITKGGDIVNVVPADVRMETYVRGRTINGILDANKKVNRALIAGAQAVGADIKIYETPGYLPLLNNQELDSIFKDNLLQFISQEELIMGRSFAGSFDFGDVSHLIPSLHPFIGGVKGNLHTREFRIVDEDLAYILPAKTIALTIVDLLYNNGEKAFDVINNFKPKMTKEEYIDLLDNLSKDIEVSGF